jgi:predicted ATPase
MRELPSGTVTFLFTDVEGSTRLLHEVGDAYAGLLAEHRRRLREVFAEHGGVEVDTQGDAFFVAFSRARDAVTAARDGQEALGEGPIRVRMGLHTGEPVLTEEGYVGMDVHRAARIAAAGHGGQVLVSRSTRDLVDPDDLRDLGRHRLKDLTAPERIYQLGPAEFPPLKSLNATNLPVASNPLVGRSAELADLASMLVDGERLVTLTGPGGSGKTRLALQACAELLGEFPGGVFFVPLAPLASAELVRPAITRTVGVPDLEEISHRRALLLLDNFEHVLDAAQEVGALLQAGGEVKVLATSRAPLRLQGECEYAVDPLPEDDGVELLIERAQSVRRDFVPDGDCAAEICRRLDGLPLALELAAGQLRFLDSATLLERLDRRLPILTGGARDVPERQRTLRATIEWSYDLLPEELQALFARFGVFVGSFTLEASEAVADVTVESLGALVEASLVKGLAGPRFLVLETIREFALERLAELEDAEALRRRHAEHYKALALTASLDTDVPTEQQPEIAIPEAANLRAALEWALERGEIEFGLELLVALEQFWVLGYTEEGTRWFRSFLDGAADVPPLLRARALRSFASSLHFAGDPLAERLCEESLVIYEGLEDEHGIAVLLHRLAICSLQNGEPDLARERAEQSLEIHRRLGNDKGACQPLSLLGVLALLSGDRANGVAMLEESAALAKRIGWRWWYAGTVSTLADVALLDGRTEDARALLREALDLALQIRDRVGLSWYLGQLAFAAALEGRMTEAGRIWGTVEAAKVFIPGGPWPRDFDALQSRLLELADDSFEEARLATGESLEELAARLQQ